MTGSTGGHFRSCKHVLGALQFGAVTWIVLNQFRDHLGLHAGDHFGLVAKGYIGAGLFFMASGYLLGDKLLSLPSGGWAGYRSLLWQRLTFTYPLHLIVLLGLAGAIFVSGAAVAPFHQGSFRFADLPANLLLIQAWGPVRTDGWNFPSWLVSADWFAFLVLPLVGAFALKSRSVVQPIAVGIGGFIGLYIATGAVGVLFTDMTTRVGALQALPAILLGVGLWRLQRERPLSVKVGLGLAILAASWIAAAASLRLTDLVIWPAFAPLIVGLAAAGDPQSAPLVSRALGWLGRIALAMQLTYLPVEMAYFRAVHLIDPNPEGLRAWLVLAGVFPIILAGAAVAYHAIQHPIWLQARQRLARPIRP